MPMRREVELKGPRASADLNIARCSADRASPPNRLHFKPELWGRRPRENGKKYIMLKSTAAPVPAVGFAIVAFQRAILDGLVVNANPLAIHVHLDATVDDAPRRGAAIGAVAAELAMSS